VIRHKLVAIVGSGALAVALAACGSSNSSNDTSGTGSGASGTITLGTTDPVTAVDPAGSYDFGSWNIQ
jgi:peptide/nickel transport system substrate-binding protein